MKQLFASQLLRTQGHLRAWVTLGLVLTMLLPLRAQNVPAEIPFRATTAVEQGAFVHVADIDQDGLSDLVVSNENNGNIAWYKNNGNGSFTENVLEDTEEDTRIVSVADLNGDGFLDIVAARYQLICYYGDATQTFSQHTVISNYENNVYDVHLRDIDNDGDIDVFVGTITPNQVRWYRNDGNDNFTLQTIRVDSQEGIISHATPDINGDGRPDIVCALRERDLPSSQDDNNTGEVHNNDGEDDETDDDDDDDDDDDKGRGIPDFIRLPFLNTRTQDARAIIYLINQGNGNFGEPQTVTEGLRHPESVAAADLDGDGRPDILSASTDDSRVAWYRNTSEDNNGNLFGSMNTVSTRLNGVKDAIAADMDGDGDMDIVAGTYQNSSAGARLVWFENDGSGNFSGERRIADQHIRWLSAADMDNDGDTDVLAVNAYVPRDIFYFENQRPVRTAPVISSFAPQRTGADSVVTISGTNLNRAGGAPGNTVVTVGNVDATEISVNEAGTQLQFTVPDLPPGSYVLQLTVDDQPATAPNDLVIQPYLLALSPLQLSSGDELTLSGVNFRSETNSIQVQLGNRSLTEDIFVNVAGTEARIMLPEDVSEGSYPVTIVVNEQSSNPLSLQVLGPSVPGPVDSTPPAFTSNNLSEAIPGDSVFVFSASVTEDATEISQVIIRSGGIVEGFSNTQVLNADATPYQFTVEIPSNLDDPLGMKYQVIAINTIGLTDTLSRHAYRRYQLGDSVLYNFAPGTPTQRDYRMVAVPFEPQAVNSAWLGDTIATYDTRFWRLFRYGDSTYQEYGEADFTDFEPGTGYMLIKRDFSFEVQGEAAHLSDESKAYLDIPLQEGWNLIGNPYPFAIRWEAVLAANPGVALPQAPKTFRDGNYSNATTLEGFEGAFVRHEGATTQLRVPISARQTTATGRYQHVPQKTVAGWEVPLTITGPYQTNTLGGFGMQATAHAGPDPYDDYPVPRFSGYLDITFATAAGRSPLTKDMVALSEQHVWEFTVNAEAPEHVQLSWDSKALQNTSKALWLIDLQHFRHIDMRAQSSYARMLPADGRASFKILYADPSEIAAMALSDRLEVGQPYPNPAEKNVYFPLSVPKKTPDRLTVAIYDAAGKKVKTLRALPLSSGFHTLVWDRVGNGGQQVPAGLYFYKVRTSETQEAHTGKLLLK